MPGAMGCRIVWTGGRVARGPRRRIGAPQGRHPRMDSLIFAAMLLAAAFHAGWNAMLKLRVEPRMASTLLGIASGLLAVPFVVVLPLPSPEAWPFLLTSMLIHVVYFQTLGWAYEAGDLGQVYPLARGSAPLLTALGAAVITREPIGATGWVGIVVLATGVIALSLKGARDTSRIDKRAVGFALVTACAIGAYTLVDGLGVRRSGNVASYIAWGFLLAGFALVVYGRLHWRGGLAQAFAGSWRMLLLGGAMSIASYGIALWAMTRAPIALVAALRETSILFAMAISLFFLGEPAVPRRFVAAGLIVAGAIALRMG